MSTEQIHFLTGRLAESALRATLENVAEQIGFSYTVQVMPITVAALMTPDWIARKISVPDGTTRVILPGYCRGSLTSLQNRVSAPVQLGPRDFRQLPRFFGLEGSQPNLEDYVIEIIAEINHVPDLNVQQVAEIARDLNRDGADIIDIGCIPGQKCSRIDDYVKALVDNGLRVSIDTLEIDEIQAATSAGAELVLSVNSSNREAAPDWGCEVVVIPDDVSRIESMEDTIEMLAHNNVPLRVDPILEPIGLGFAASLHRYQTARSRWPDVEIMMGIGNLTELTDVDSAGINFMLLGFCQETSIRSVLTTQVINWARSSVSECNIARRLVHYACKNKVPPKNLSQQLVTLRDGRLLEFSEDQIRDLACQIRDNNYRILTGDQMIHLLGSGQQFSDADPFQLFDALSATNPDNLNPAHAFYLGYELCKAMTAITLGKNYVQDEALDWGHLTVNEQNRHRLTEKFGRNSR